MHNTAKFFAAIALMSSTGAMAGSTQIPMGKPVIPMGVDVPTLGADLSLPVLAGIAAIALVAGIRYIRNKRS